MPMKQERGYNNSYNNLPRCVQRNEVEEQEQNGREGERKRTNIHPGQ
jgi:hypothetical protein